MAAWSPILAFRVPAWTEPKGIDILTFMVALIGSSVGGEVANFNGTINPEATKTQGNQLW